MFKSVTVNLRRIVLVFVLMTGSGFDGNAQDLDFWDAPGGGLFHVGSNWLDGSAPDSNDISAFFLNSDYSVFWNSTTGSTTNSFTNVANGNVTFLSLGGTPFQHRTLNDFTISDGSLTLGGGSGTNTGVTLVVDRDLVLNGSGQLNIAGADVFAETVTVGNASGPASLEIIGTDSLLFSNSLQIGGLGTGALNVQDGGSVVSQYAAIGREGAAR